VIRALLTICLTLALCAAAVAQERVSFASSDADLTGGTPTQLTGLLWLPAGAGPHPAIVLMHGCAGAYARSGAPAARHRDWAERFVALGYVALLVDSFGPRGQDELCTKRERTILPGRERARDAIGALMHVQARADVIADRVMLLGWSHGGSTVLAAVDRAQDLRPRDLIHDFRAAVAFYPGCRTALESRRGWSTRTPLLILIGDADDWTPPGPCKQLAARAGFLGIGGAVELHVYPDAHHGFDAPNSPLSVRRDVALTASGTATVGTDPAARADAIERVPAFLARNLAR
jgi:dienelactone hydrolase